VKQRRVDNIEIIQLESNLDDEKIVVLNKCISDLVIHKNKPDAVILIFGQIHAVDSQALGLIIAWHNEAQQNQIKFALCDIGEFNMEVIRLAQLDKLLTIYPTEEEAIKQIKD